MHQPGGKTTPPRPTPEGAGAVIGVVAATGQYGRAAAQRQRRNLVNTRNDEAVLNWRHVDASVASLQNCVSDVDVGVTRGADGERYRSVGVVARCDRRAIVGNREWCSDRGALVTGDEEPQSEEALQELIIRMLEGIPRFFVGMELPEISDGSRMAADSAATQSLRLSLPTACAHYLDSSAELLGSLHQLMLPRPKALQLLRFSLYPLLRGVIESSGQTVWVLGPEEQRDRVLRLLQILRAELLYDGKTVDVQNRPLDDDPPEMRALLQANHRDAAPRRRMRWQWLLETAASLGIDQTEFEHGIPGGYEALLRQAGAEQGIDGPWRGRSCAGAWMFVSGLAHPSFSRSFGSAINESEEIDGEFVVWTRTDPKFVFRLLKAAINLHMTALKLWAASCAPQPDNDGAPEL